MTVQQPPPQPPPVNLVESFHKLDPLGLAHRALIAEHTP
jgi:hypothetical protein